MFVTGLSLVNYSSARVAFSDRKRKPLSSYDGKNCAYCGVKAPISGDKHLKWMHRLRPTDKDAYRYSIDGCRAVIAEVLTANLSTSSAILPDGKGIRRRFKKLERQFGQFDDPDRVIPHKLPALFTRLARALDSLKPSQEHIWPRHFKKNMRGGHYFGQSLGTFNLLCSCSRCNEAKGRLSFPAYIRHLDVVKGTRSADAALKHVIKHVQWRFQNIVPGESHRAARRLLGNIGHMALGDEADAHFPPTPEKLMGLFALFQRVPQFKTLLSNAHVQAVLNYYLNDPAVGEIATSLLSEAKGLKLATKTA